MNFRLILMTTLIKLACLIGRNKVNRTSLIKKSRLCQNINKNIKFISNRMISMNMDISLTPWN